MSTLSPGQDFAGYTLIEPRGSGGYGEVWAARTKDGSFVALKFVRTRGVNSLQAATLERRGVEIVHNNPHRNLVKIHRWWFHPTDDDPEYFVIEMDLADKSLPVLLDEWLRSSLLGVPREDLLRYLDQAAAALDWLHHLGVVHRDVKPDNILLKETDEKGKFEAVVADFSLTRADELFPTKSDDYRTLAFTAPDDKASYRADQWSLAASYCWVRKGGKYLFEASLRTWFEVVKGADPDLAFLDEEERPAVRRALAREPEKRFKDCSEFVRQLTNDIQKDDEEATMSQEQDPKSGESEQGQRVRREPGRGWGWRTKRPNDGVLPSKDEPKWLTPSLFVAVLVLAGIVCIGFLWWALSKNGGAPADQTATGDTVSRKDFEALHAQLDTLTHKLDGMVVVKDDGAKREAGVTGYILVGDTMIQWGVSKTTPPSYAAQNFAPAFQAPPTVTGSIDGNLQNDVYCNITNVSATGFAFVGVILGGDNYTMAARDFHWMAIGQRKK